MHGRYGALAAVTLLLACPRAGADETAPLRAAPPGTLVDAPYGKGAAEIVRFNADATAALRRVALEASLRLEDWPVAPSVRQSVLLTRHDVYAPDARLVKIEDGREVEVRRSQLLFFWGTAEGDPRTRVLAYVDPDAGSLGGLSVSPDGMHEIVPAAADEPGRYLVAAWDSRIPAREGQPVWSCGRAEEGSTAGDSVPGQTDSVQVSALSSLHTVVVAVDTDNELLSIKFADNVTSAANYLATLFASLNVIYERDLFVRLLQGYSILRVSSAPDPYVQGTGGGASSAQLSEFRTYWNANYGGVRRGLAMMLSGKQSSPNSSSGIASLGVLCSTAFGYSFSQVFKYAGSTGASDAFVVGHELGHNFGSHHTHCFPSAAAPVDRCYNAEPGCYTGVTACPSPFTIDPVNGGPVNSVRGTLMSYCHVLGGCAASSIFHPQSVDVIAPRIDSGVGVCVFPQGSAAPTVTGINPSSGPGGCVSSVTITGSNFRLGATISFADRSSATAATGVTVVSSSQITATLPIRPGGLTDVIVANPDQLTGTLRDGFMFAPNPVLCSISPNSGTTEGGTAVTITGGNFQAPATVSLGGALATSVDVVNPTTITAVAAPHAAGTVNLVVTIPGPLGATLSNAFFYVAPSGGLGLYTIDPCRLVDTRTTDGPALTGQSNRLFTVTDKCGVPSAAKAISVNLTAVGPASVGFFSLYPGNGLPSATSSLNFSAAQTRANNTVVLLATDGTGRIGVRNGSAGAVHFVLDVNGYFR